MGGVGDQRRVRSVFCYIPPTLTYGGVWQLAVNKRAGTTEYQRHIGSLRCHGRRPQENRGDKTAGQSHAFTRNVASDGYSRPDSDERFGFVPVLARRAGAPEVCNRKSPQQLPLCRIRGTASSRYGDFRRTGRQAARKPPDKDARSMCRCFRREMVRHRFFRRSLALLDSVAEILPRSTNSRLTSDVALESFSASRSDWFGGRSCPFVGIRPAVECHENHFGGTASVCSRADFVLPLSSEAAFTLRIIGLPCPLGKTRASTGSDSSAEIRRALTSPRR
jgi:hypothetical protein